MEAIYLTRSLFITAQSKQADQQHPDNGLLLEWRPGQPVRQRRLAALLPTNNLAPGISRRVNCQDNAVAESFFSSLKKERIRKRIYKTRDLARADIFNYIEVFYNRARRHSHLDGVSLEAFEQASS